MKVLSLERLNGPGNVLAYACVQIAPDIRVNDLRLVRAGSGDLRVFSPNSRGSNILSFSPAAIAELKKIIIEAYRGMKPHDQQPTTI
ncbi:MAG: hypothetical protein AB7P20_09430 [Rhizobiaceae bacterium]